MPRSASRDPLDLLDRRLKREGAPDTLRRLARLMFATAQAEDIARLEPDDLLWLARAAHRLLERRRPGRALVRIVDPDLPSVELSRVSVLQSLADNMPFLVDSLLGYLAEQGLEIRLLLHPVLHVARDAEGRLEALAAAPEAGDRLRAESLIHVHLPRLSAAEKERLRNDVESIFAHVRAAVLDWPAMRQKLADVIDGYQAAPPPLPVEELTETIAFLQWLLADNFVFLGVREYDLGEGASVAREPGLGILRLAAGDGTDRAERAVEMADGVICRPAARAEPVLITKSAETSMVHRRVPMDLIIVKRFNAA
ncbi:MAG TPA: hypothetical protein ENK13_02575, partial [Thermopetrobacter sp.]|nr:hypothetical protein [Thermopetrobacter sp.]